MEIEKLVINVIKVGKRNKKITSRKYLFVKCCVKHCGKRNSLTTINIPIYSVMNETKRNSINIQRKVVPILSKQETEHDLHSGNRLVITISSNKHINQILNIIIVNLFRA